MKKKLVLGLILSMLITMSVPVINAKQINSTDTQKTQNITVDYTVGEMYTIVIPSDLTLVEEANAVAQKVEAKDVRLTSNKVLSVTMSSATYDTSYRVGYDGSYIKYMVKQGDTESDVNTEITDNNVTLFTVESGKTQKSSYLKFYTTNEEILKATKAGNHKDTLTFACEVN